jgi:ABC-type phosphate/phosphonate transport system substrate-binding protein
MTYVANARMYSVNPAAAAAWKELFGWLARQADVDLHVIDHAFPQPLSELWSRPDLGCGFMCGFPYALAACRPRAVAAPVPVRAVIPGQPCYATRLIVRSDSRYQTLEQTFGGRLGYTVGDSHSGYNALRHHLLPYYQQRGAKLYRESVGPLFTPHRVIDALLAGDIDVGPLDSYALDLMLYYQPDLASQITIVATTDPAPIPFLVAAPGCPDDIVSALKMALLQFGSVSAYAELRARLCLERFVPVAMADYDLTRQWDAEAVTAGYAQPG